MSLATIVSWIARIGIAGIFVMAAVGKLTADAEAAAMFEKVGGAAMMYLTGVLEAIAAVLLLNPRTKAYGAVLAAGVMAGAIVSHLTVLGTGGMFPLAIVLFVLASVLIVLHRAELPVVGKHLSLGTDQTGSPA